MADDRHCNMTKNVEYWQEIGHNKPLEFGDTRGVL